MGAHASAPRGVCARGRVPGGPSARLSWSECELVLGSVQRVQGGWAAPGLSHPFRAQGSHSLAALALCAAGGQLTRAVWGIAANPSVNTPRASSCRSSLARMSSPGRCGAGAGAEVAGAPVPRASVGPAPQVERDQLGGSEEENPACDCSLQPAQGKGCAGSGGGWGVQSWPWPVLSR